MGKILSSLNSDGIVEEKEFDMAFTVDVQEMASYLEGITTDELRKVYDPVDMEYQAVYKFSLDGAEEEWQYICQFFEGLKAFYIEVAAHQEGVLVITD